MDRLKYLDDALWRAAVEIVDVKDDAADPVLLLGLLLLQGLELLQGAARALVGADRGQLPVVVLDEAREGLSPRG